MTCIDNRIPNSNTHLRSLERVSSYPIVNDSYLVALDYYHWAKSKNLILDVTLNKLEGVLKTVKDKTEPIAAERLHFLDDTVCHQLERFEKVCPMILEPSKTIASIPGNVYHQRIEPSIQSVVHPVTQTIDLVTKTSCATAYAMSSILAKVLPPINATKTVLDKTEQLLDRYFPEKEVDRCPRDTDEGIYEKVKHFSSKTRHRIYRKVLIDIERFQKVSLAKLDQIYSIIQEIRTSKTSVCRETVASIRDNIRYQQIVNDGLNYSNYLHGMLTSTAKAMPRLLCSGTMVALDLINDQLSTVRTTIQESTNRNLVSEKRINQAANTIDFVRSWIEYFADNLKEYYRKCEKKERDESLIEDDEEVHESSSLDGNSESDEDDN